MDDGFKRRCNEPDCEFPDCNCWEIKNRFSQGRVLRLEEALRNAQLHCISNDVYTRHFADMIEFALLGEKDSEEVRHTQE